MASKRDRLLQQLGITQWVLHRPAVLQGEIAISLPDDIRLLIVGQSFPDPGDPLLCDILHSLDLTSRQIYSLTPEQVAMLPENIRCNSWRMGISEPLVIAGVQLHSPALAELYQDVSAKRALWQQICQYEEDFYPDAK